MSYLWLVTLAGVAMVVWAAFRLHAFRREAQTWQQAPEALARARAALGAGDRPAGWSELRHALPAGFIRLEHRQRCEHIASVLETAIGNADTLGLGEERWWVLAGAAHRLRQGAAASSRPDRTLDEAERELIEQAVRTIRTRGRNHLRREVREAVREARRAIEGDTRASKPPRMPALS